jgi:hypothetical protein
MLWDKESDRWHCESDDIPGLILESASFDALVERIRIAAPEILELNLGHIGEFEITFDVYRVETIGRAS